MSITAFQLNNQQSKLKIKSNLKRIKGHSNNSNTLEMEEGVAKVWTYFQKLILSKNVFLKNESINVNTNLSISFLIFEYITHRK